jgi:hypothetical protein
MKKSVIGTRVYGDIVVFAYRPEYFFSTIVIVDQDNDCVFQRAMLESVELLFVVFAEKESLTW